MPYIKIYNPDDKDMVLGVGETVLSLPSKKIVVFEDTGFVPALKEIAPGVEIAPATEEEFQSLKPTVELKKKTPKLGKKGK